MMKYACLLSSAITVSLSLPIGLIPTTEGGELMIVGIDTKVELTKQSLVKTDSGRDAVMIFEIGNNPTEPALMAKLPLINSLFGPPTNLAICPDGS